MSANWSLQKGIFETLTAAPQVTSLLGGANIYDHVPPNARFPYVTFGQSEVRDWSTGSEEGREHVLTLHVWSRTGGRKQTQEIIGALDEALQQLPITLDGERLVNLHFEFAEARRDPDGETVHGIVRYRAVTEPLN